MDISRPEFIIIVILIVFIAESGNIVRERVYPHIHDMIRIKGNGYAPLEARSRYAQILEPGPDEIIDKLDSACLGSLYIC